MTPSSYEHVLVLGGGLAGIFTAMALAPHADRLTVVEADPADADPSARRGAPQARHTHVLISGGARAIDDLSPGATRALRAAGAVEVNIPGRYLGLIHDGWQPRFHTDQFILGCTRGLLESLLRERLRQIPNVTTVDHTHVDGLTGGTERITGARLGTDAVPADLVVDATGRRSAADRWLTELGFPQVPERVVDPGIFYATCIFESPPGLPSTFPGLNVQTQPGSTEETRRGGVALPIEGNRWTVTLAGARGSEPSTAPDAFHAYAAVLPYPTIADFISAANPIGTPVGFRADANRLRQYERLRPAPHGFLAIGDAYATFNPVYGHGMATAALAAVAVRNLLRKSPNATTNALQRAVARASSLPWAMAVGQDLRYPQTRGPRPGVLARLLNRLQDRVAAGGATDVEVAKAHIDLFVLAAPPSRMLNRHILRAALRGPRRSALPAPPFTPEEAAVLTRPPR
ncbi:2-polyprenyl-6-methoxyphenol hydroxylase-like FAD-dependent oxidoreductase [Crossiella equi]|uniref:2-polyprenyl-6-methoxyphenol hydroxylase-like FAD-dependent oxidoreductase n=1 Tax=Crossiella equi TaxID=130796 RepID=A0ABS5A3H6_9PSEU|nr:enterotoxin [Crossiella equi]MBP2471140.1 2-polyprenyl-6-methoxyphenol hydroxylase-like FAD-dependent oxidoreductase [Crossiella equi]